MLIGHCSKLWITPIMVYICTPKINAIMRYFFSKKWIKVSFYTLVILFALVGFFLTASYMAIKLRLTDESGSVDVNNRYFESIKDKYNQSYQMEHSDFNKKGYRSLQRILFLNDYYPRNAEFILNAWKKTDNELEILRMLDAVDIQLKEDKDYQAALKEFLKKEKKESISSNFSAFDWMNIMEWGDFKIAVAKDKKLIDSAANATGVEARLIVACLVGEQIRLFNSSREAYKKWIGPLKILSVESTVSFGVTGIKEHTALQIESHLKNPKSEFYLGANYEKLLDFNSNNPQSERITRLTSYKNHYYSYLYAAIFLKQVKMQWERAGFPIDKRPEILATLFNVGYPQSVPKSNPRVGGSTIKIKDKGYTFGAVAYQFYYSGELFDLFPFEEKKFDWID